MFSYLAYVTRSVQSTPADNTRKRVWQYIEKEKKERPMATFFGSMVIIRTNVAEVHDASAFVVSDKKSFSCFPYIGLC